ncbi:hypothetical protein DLH72_00880 [Candidatus Gracilibacteria bacterium]|nr:MAG: hypothetical protein DLH72_00880 [Candidatus Gracilibacteria bacterium]
MDDILKSVNNFLFKYKFEIIFGLIISFFSILGFIFSGFYYGIDKNFMENKYAIIFFSILSLVFILFLLIFSGLGKYFLGLFILKNSKYKLFKIIFIVLFIFPLYFLFIFFRDFFEVFIFYLLNFSLLLFILFLLTGIFLCIFIIFGKIFPGFRNFFENF